jgi:hypothetical protein
MNRPQTAHRKGGAGNLNRRCAHFGYICRQPTLAAIASIGDGTTTQLNKVTNCPWIIVVSFLPSNRGSLSDLAHGLECEDGFKESSATIWTEDDHGMYGS